MTQLVGATCGASVAADAFQFLQHGVYFHPLHKAGDALKVAVAATIEDHVVQGSPSGAVGERSFAHLEIDTCAASTYSIICIIHIYVSCD